MTEIFGEDIIKMIIAKYLFILWYNQAVIMKSRKKLFIQIPCLDEEATIAQVIKSIPKKELEKQGFSVKVLIIDDGSSDQTSKVARIAGADMVFKHKKSLGLAKTFEEGLKYSLNKGADIIVSTDGDNQYDQTEILKIVKPVAQNKADMVIGDRQVNKLNFMPMSKRVGNSIGSWIIRLLTSQNTPDASSGFRAFSADLAKKFNLQSNHTYTHETIIQAANKGAIILSVPIKFKKRYIGESRLISNGIFSHINKSMETIFRTIILYKAFKYLFTAGLIFLLLGILPGLRFLYFYFSGEGRGHTQSLILSSVLINLGLVVILLGIIADLISVNRKLIEEMDSKLK